MKSLETKIPAPVVAAILGGVMKFYALSAHIQIDASPLLETIGVKFAELSALIALSAFVSFWFAKTTINPLDPSQASALVTSGIFRITRNPMYLSLLLLLIAYTIRLGSWVEGIGPILFAAYVTRFQIIPEERILSEKFGSAFLAYMSRTRRWI
ncbi:MAG TPA: isoprenylcysteine carboxylmethyltransferase family protein [Rhodocyclaceae bacterium]|nr:isoprenylcysteine carboxylmethyltransferase family protein [Rhodocyclaceae bacterium]